MPVPPGERWKNVPATVSAIIMKLLAKTAEERYQTAAGVQSDLRRCLAEWETQRRIDEFPLGQHDTPDRLLIPEKLYGRAQEIDILLASFDHVVASGVPGFKSGRNQDLVFCLRESIKHGCSPRKRKRNRTGSCLQSWTVKKNR
jgi:hypothetical protein